MITHSAEAMPKTTICNPLRNERPSFCCQTIYKANTPTKPTAPASPNPMMFVGIDAPPVEDELSPCVAEAPLSLPLPDPEFVAVLVIVVGPRVEVRERVVELPVEFAELVGPAEMTEPVALGKLATGTRYVWTSEGRAVNHAGVEPAENSEAISLETAAELVRASWMRLEGRAVWRTEMTETLRRCQVVLIVKVKCRYSQVLHALAGAGALVLRNGSGREGGNGDKLVLHLGCFAKCVC